MSSLSKIPLPAWRRCVRRRVSLSHTTSPSTLAIHRQYTSLARTKSGQENHGRDNRSQSARLGLRSSLPPDTPPEPRERTSDLSDQEWEIRTGRALHVLQQTLPDFFTTGIATSIDKSTGMPPDSSNPIVNANPMDPYSQGDGLGEDIYSPKIKMTYTPPVPLPAPFPKTLGLEGLPFYVTFSSCVRHTLNALYSDLQLNLTRFIVNNPKAKVSTTSEGERPRPRGRPRHVNQREKNVLVSFRVTGTSRMTGAQAEWDVASTYTFSPKTGLIHTHVVNSIYPAPHQAVYDSLRLSFGKVFDWGIEERPSPGSGRAACGGSGVTRTAKRND